MKIFNKKFFMFSVAIIIVFSLGGLSSYIFFSSGNLNKSTALHSVEKRSINKPLYWVAPMNPNYRRNKSGKSPMGMDLVPVYGENNESGTIKISPAIVNNLGVRTTVVKKQDIKQIIKTVGYVQSDKSASQTVSVYTAGWIRDLQVKSSGDFVKKNQLLFKIYSPALVSSQQELLLALKYNNKSLAVAGERKLITLGMSKIDISKLISTHTASHDIGIYAQKSGYINKLKINEGAHVMPSSSIMNIIDLSKVWIIAEVRERQTSLLKVGQLVEAKFNGLPKKIWVGKINYIYPVLNEKTRATRVRIIFNNNHGALKPNMFANLSINISDSRPKLAIPKEALIQLGDHDRVVLALGNGKFKSVIVKVGAQSQDLIVITNGLKVGDKIVTSANFLLDSESNLKAGLSRLDSSNKKNNPTIDANKEVVPGTMKSMPPMNHGHH